MEEIKTIEYAQSLFEEGNYEKAFEICLALVDESPKEANLLLVKSLPFFMNYSSDKDKETYNNLLLILFEGTEGIEEFFKVQQEISSASQEAYVFCLKSELAQIEKYPTLSNWYSFLEMPPKILMVTVQIFLSPVICDKRQELCTNAGLTADEAEKMYANPSKDIDTNTEVKDYANETALRIFKRGKRDLQYYINNNINYSIDRIESYTYALLVAELMAEYSVPKDTKTQKADRVIVKKRLLEVAEMLEYKLNVCVPINGRSEYVYSGNAREDVINKLKETYKKIAEIDPLFEIPSVARFIEPKTSQNSNGCYIATAVYGSYECPQVWTLRRYRDNILAKNWYGRLFIHTYYAISPTLVKWFGNTYWFTKLWKNILDSIVKNLQAIGIKSSPYKDKNWR